MSTYKRPVQLKEQLSSILSQTYRNIEIVVSDNDPEGSGRFIAEAITDDRVKYHCNPENLGMVRSFNASVQRSKGEFIVMVTDDDPVYPDMLEVLLDLRKKHPGYGVYGGCGDWIVETEFSARSLKEEVGAKRTTLSSMPENAVLEIAAKDFPDMYLDGPLTSVFMLWSCCIMEREVIEEIKGMPDYGSELLTDHAYMIAGGAKKGVVYINRPFGGQSVRGDNFGYHFDRIKEKYLSTPRLFYGYLKSHLEILPGWEHTEKKLWNFIGRGWVEYSLMIFRSQKAKNEPRGEFFKLFRKVFKDKKISRWKWKFYLKAYFGRVFKLLLKLKKGS